MKIFIAVPCGELTRYPEFWQSILNQQLPTGTVTITDQCRGTYISENQNILARRFLTTDADFFWLTNDDQVYMPDCLARLVAHSVPVCAPICLQRNSPFRPLVYDRDDGGMTGDIHPLYLTSKLKGLVPVAAAGGGGMLIRRDVLEKVGDPWWEVHTVRAAGAPPNQMSEDIDFCRKVRASGFKVYCDTDCCVGHQGVFTLWPSRDPNTGEWATAIQRNETAFFAPPASENQPDPR